MESTGVPRTQFASSLPSQMLGNERALGGSEEQQKDKLLFPSNSQTEPAFLACTESYEDRKGISQPCAVKSNYLIQCLSPSPIRNSMLIRIIYFKDFLR